MTTTPIPMHETWEQAEYRQYSCLFCGHIYDEEEGDSDSGIAPGTRWEDISDDWCCPMCSAGKADFELI